MAGSTAADNKRLLVVTAGNLRQNHLYIKDHLDFFPPDCIGGSRKNANGTANPIEIVLDGMDEVIETDIPTDAKTGKPRGFLRDRKSVGRFFKRHHVKDGDNLALERIGNRRYQLTVASANGNGNVTQPTAAEFFAGIGLVRLALEQQGWEVVFANDIDEDKAKMYRDNWPANDHLVVGDIHKLDVDQIPTCDLFTASFPCNDLSIAGRMEGPKGKESSAFWGFVEFLKKPKDRRPVPTSELKVWNRMYRSRAFGFCSGPHFSLTNLAISFWSNAAKSWHRRNSSFTFCHMAQYLVQFSGPRTCAKSIWLGAKACS